VADPSLRSTGQLDLPLAPGRRLFSVSELNAAIQIQLSNEFSNIWVAGEISGCRLAASGHYYFTLKDSNSQLRTVLFKSSLRLSKIRPQDGLAVLARGRLEVYEARGEYQLIAEFLELRGFGVLQVAFERLKTKLEAEGLFDSRRKRALPCFPTRIALVTSPAGAVLRDMLQVLGRRFPGLHIRLFPTPVQGENSVEQICKAIDFFSRNPWAQVVILARGGGSLEDLWSFNEEPVARAISASTVPVISAIGHETDFTIADFVADHRAPTPSAAAEIVICTRESVFEQLENFRTRATQSLRYRVLVLARELSRKAGDRPHALILRLISQRAQQVDELDRRLVFNNERTLQVRRKKLADLLRRLGENNIELRLARSRHRHHLLSDRLHRSWQNALANYNSRLAKAQAQVAHLSPLAVLQRGYALVQTPDGRLIRDSEEATVGDRLTIRLNRGRLESTVTRTDPE
jgi:exodeoxyribonuclease VII large subunit